MILNATKRQSANLKPVFFLSFHATIITTEQLELTVALQRLTNFADHLQKKAKCVCVCLFLKPKSALLLSLADALSVCTLLI